MAIVCPNVGEIILLQYLLNMAPVACDDKVLHLYTNDVTPSETDTLGTFTQATEAGYTPYTMTSASWTTTEVGGTTTGVYSQHTFNFTTAATVYGYYVTDKAGTGLLWVERFAGAPFTLPDDGGTIAVTPRLELQ